MAVIHHGPGHVSSREHVGHARDPHERINGNPAEMVGLDREQPGQRNDASTQTRAPIVL